MTGVAGVPVIVARVAVEQRVSAAAHTLNDAGTRCDGRHILTGDCRHLMQGYSLLCDDLRLHDRDGADCIALKLNAEQIKTPKSHTLASKIRTDGAYYVSATYPEVHSPG